MPGLDPPRGPGCFLENNVIQKLCCFGKSLFGRKQTVFVFDREHSVVAEHAQRRNKFLPPLRAMTITAGAKYPSTVALICIRFSVQNSSAQKVCWIELRVLCVHMENRIAQNTYRGDGINVLPEHMAWVIIAANGRPGNFAQPQQRLRTIQQNPDAFQWRSSRHGPQQTLRAPSNKV